MNLLWVYVWFWRFHPLEKGSHAQGMPFGLIMQNDSFGSSQDAVGLLENDPDFDQMHCAKLISITLDINVYLNAICMMRGYTSNGLNVGVTHLLAD